jgi:hypothetical protein
MSLFRRALALCALAGAALAAAPLSTSAHAAPRTPAGAPSMC